MIQVIANKETQLEPQVDEVIASFDAWFQAHLQAEPLVRSERTIIKTFLWFMLKTEQEAK